MSSPSNLEVNSADNQLALMRGQINIATIWVRRSGTLDDFKKKLKIVLVNNFLTSIEKVEDIGFVQFF